MKTFRNNKGRCIAENCYRCSATDLVIAQYIKALLALVVGRKDNGNTLSVCFHIVVGRRGKTLVSVLQSMTSAWK